MVLPEFVVVTGENGSGKSQFLEAIYQQRIHGSWGGSQEDIRFVTNEQLGTPTEFRGGEESREAQVARFEAAVRQIDLIRGQSPYNTPEGLNAGLRDLLRPLGITDAGFARLSSRTSWSIADWTRDDFAEHTPIDFGAVDPFSVSVGDVFSRYNQVLMTNDVNRFLASEGSDVSFKSEADFQADYGRPPWELLNSALERVGLRYRFSAPPRSVLPLTVPPVLTDPVSGVQLSVSMLSTGERALLSLAMSIYSVSNRREQMRLPRLVLLDEPDAALHPSMVRSLIMLLVEDFVNDLGIPVILTTHSPTTVAIAPDESLFIMSKDGSPRLQPAPSKDAALSHLLVGVPSVSVRAENRRVVVVESGNDESRYTALSFLLSGPLASERSLVFMAAGGTQTANGSAAVIELVSRLRDNGNLHVWGLVDRDDRNVEPHPNVYMNAERYTIENLILDPISVGLLLLDEGRDAIRSDLAPINYVGFDLLSHGQIVADYVSHAVASTTDDMSAIAVAYAGGATFSLPVYWLETKGHTLSGRVLDRFPSLRAYRDENGVMDAVIRKIWSNRTSVVPESVVRTFERLLS